MLAHSKRSTCYTFKYAWCSLCVGNTPQLRLLKGAFYTLFAFSDIIQFNNPQKKSYVAEAEIVVNLKPQLCELRGNHQWGSISVQGIKCQYNKGGQGNQLFSFFGK